MATTAQSGNYKVGSTWVGGVVPADGETKIIAAGNTVTIDSDVIVLQRLREWFGAGA